MDPTTLLPAAYNDHIMRQLAILAEVAVDLLGRCDALEDLELVEQCVSQLVLKLAHASNFRLPFPSYHRCRPYSASDQVSFGWSVGCSTNSTCWLLRYSMMLRRKTWDLVKSCWSQIKSTVAKTPCGNRNAVEELGLAVN